MIDALEVQGSVAPEFAAVKDAFVQNFKDGLEVGASLNITVEGEQVVDLWAGHADAEKTKPWNRDTLVNVWSTTKGITSIAVAILVDRGLLRYRDTVAQHWPDFAQGGKSDVTVGQLLSHQAGLCGMRQPTVVEDFYDWDKTCRRLAAMEPFWKLGEGSGYHAITFGFLAGELIRRIDGRTPGTFIKEEIAEPLGADFHVGLPENLENRVSLVIKAPTPPQLTGEQPPDYVIATMANPPIDSEFPHDRGWRAAEIPSANGHGTAHALSRIYAAMANGGSIDGVKIISKDTIKRATTEQCNGTDRILGMPSRWGAGFALNNGGLYGPNDSAFGHSGMGGSMGYADPSKRVSVGYTMNQMQAEIRGDSRTLAINKALYECL
ncbi:MAG: class A beta-lactamase-related serine hydrolase [Alphaproteobacteria bacterium]|nr:MAG: class A beta-lactamase-related serine hydrolase [Alphaproteobacteria bacterium]